MYFLLSLVNLAFTNLNVIFLPFDVGLPIVTLALLRCYIALLLLDFPEPVFGGFAPERDGSCGEAEQFATSWAPTPEVPCCFEELGQLSKEAIFTHVACLPVDVLREYGSDDGPRVRGSRIAALTFAVALLPTTPQRP